MSNKQYVTISELARQAGVTRQTVYNRLVKGELSNYTKVVDNKKLFNIKALELFDVKQGVKLDVKQDVKLDVKESVKLDTEKQPPIDYQREYIESLKSTIEAQRKQIDQLNTQLTQALTLTSQGHYLLADTDRPRTADQELQDTTAPTPKRRHWWQR